MTAIFSYHFIGKILAFRMSLSRGRTSSESGKSGNMMPHSISPRLPRKSRQPNTYNSLSKLDNPGSLQVTTRQSLKFMFWKNCLGKLIFRFKFYLVQSMNGKPWAFQWLQWHLFQCSVIFMYAVLRLNESTTPLIFSLIRMFQDDFSNIALVCVDPVLVVSTACVHSCNGAAVKLVSSLQLPFLSTHLMYRKS